MTSYFHSCKELPTELGHWSFGSFMFFTTEYQEARGSNVFKLKAEPNLIHVRHLCDCAETTDEQALIDAAIEEVIGVARREGIHCDRELAEKYLGQRRSIENEDDGVDCEAGWSIQTIAADLAISLGFDGVITPDEMGDSVMIKMTPDMLVSMTEVEDDE